MYIFIHIYTCLYIYTYRDMYSERETAIFMRSSKQQIVGRQFTALGTRRSKEISDELNLQAFDLRGVLFQMAIINTQPQQALGFHQEIVGASERKNSLFPVWCPQLGYAGDLADLPSL